MNELVYVKTPTIEEYLTCIYIPHILRSKYIPHYISTQLNLY